MLPGVSGRRILMTTDSLGGIWTYGLDLGRGLSELGHAVTLAVLGPTLDDGRWVQAEAAGFRVVDTGHPPEWLAVDAAAVAATARAVARLAAESGADLVHLNHPALAAAAAFPCRTVGVAHSCVATWWDAVRGTPLPPDFAWRTALVADGYRALDRLIAPSHAFAAATARRYGLPRPPAVVHNGRAARPISRQRAAIDVVFTAGRLWDEAKGMATLDRAAARLASPILAAGPTQGPNGSACSFTTLRTLGVLGEDAVADHLAGRPLYAAPALYEPFGLAVAEAAQAGCALVLSDIPTFRELWDGAASFVPPRDADALATVLAALLADPGRREALGDAAASRAARHTPDAMVAGTLAVHDAVLGSSATRTRPSAA